MKFYAGIGSRETPLEIRNLMTDWARHLRTHDYILRTGGADGADAAFAYGVPHEEIRCYLPWQGFNGLKGIVLAGGDVPWAEEIAKTHHPAWDNLTQGGRKLHTRNVCQVLGHWGERTPSKFVLCWTPGGKGGGGTGQALRIAKAYDVPVFDFGKKGDAEEFETKFKRGDFCG